MVTHLQFARTYIQVIKCSMASTARTSISNMLSQARSTMPAAMRGAGEFEYACLHRSFSVRGSIERRRETKMLNEDCSLPQWPCHCAPAVVLCCVLPPPPYAIYLLPVAVLLLHRLLLHLQQAQVHFCKTAATAREEQQQQQQMHRLHRKEHNQFDTIRRQL